MVLARIFPHPSAHLPVPALTAKRKLSSPIYLKGFPSFVSWLSVCSTTLVVHWFTLLCWQVLPPIALSMAYWQQVHTISFTRHPLAHSPQPQRIPKSCLSILIVGSVFSYYKNLTPAHSYIFLYRNDIQNCQQNHFWQTKPQIETKDPCGCWLLIEQQPSAKQSILLTRIVSPLRYR